MISKSMLGLLCLLVVACGMNSKTAKTTDDSRQKVISYSTSEVEKVIAPTCKCLEEKRTSQDLYGKTLHYALESSSCSDRATAVTKSEFTTSVTLVNGTLTFTNPVAINKTSIPTNFRTEVITDKYVKIASLCKKALAGDTVSNTESIATDRIRQFSFSTSGSVVQIKINDYMDDNTYPQETESLSIVSGTTINTTTLPTTGFVMTREIRSLCTSGDCYDSYILSTIDYL